MSDEQDRPDNYRGYDPQYPDDLTAVKTPATTINMRGDGKEIFDLPVAWGTTRDDGEPTVTISTWGFTARQAERILAGANVCLQVFMFPPVPVHLSIEAPFCDEGHETVFSQEHGRFACLVCKKLVQPQRPDGSVMPSELADPEPPPADPRADFRPGEDIDS